jgi:hypothetical protein
MVTHFFPGYTLFAKLLNSIKLFLKKGKFVSFCVTVYPVYPISCIYQIK